MSRELLHFEAVESRRVAERVQKIFSECHPEAEVRVTPVEVEAAGFLGLAWVFVAWRERPPSSESPAGRRRSRRASRAPLDPRPQEES